MFGRIKRQFFSGLVIFVPVSLTIYFIWLFFLLISQTLLPIVTHQRFIEVPGAAIRPLSFFLTLLLIWFLGLVASNLIGRRVVSLLEKGIHRLPFFRGLYEAIQKITEAFFGVNKAYQAAVLVEYPQPKVYTYGFVTSEISGQVFGSEEDYVCVFIPTVPNPTSGFLLYVPRSKTIALAISIEEVAKIIFSHGFLTITKNAIQPRQERNP